MEYDELSSITRLCIMSPPAKCINNDIRLSVIRMIGLFLIAACLASQQCHGLGVSSSSMLSSSSLPAEPRSMYNHPSSIDNNNNNIWTPIGPGDPLNKDPTYDYSPPVLNRVRYWADTIAKGSVAAEPPAAASYQRHVQNNPHNNVVHKTKTDILLLGVPAIKRPQFQAADYTDPQAQTPQQQPLQQQPRRNYYAQLPTVLMPPPMQTLTNTEQRYPSTGIAMPWPQSLSAITNIPDSFHQASGLYINVADPNSIATTISTTPQQQPPQYYHRKKPWIQALLQKEVTPPTRVNDVKTIMMHSTQTAQNNYTTIPSSRVTVSMLPSTPVFESHTTRLSSDSLPPTMLASTSYSNQFANKIPPTTTQHHHASPFYTRPGISPAYTHSTHSLSNQIIDTTAGDPDMHRPTFHHVHSTSWETNAHFTPTIRPYAMPSMSSATSSDASTDNHVNVITIDPMYPQYKPSRSQLDQQQHTIGPSYLIIEGHSKVKTYGNYPAGRHEPNVRPVRPVDPVVRTVLRYEKAELNENQMSRTADDGDRFQVRHLHYKQAASPEQHADAIQAAAEAAQALETTTATTDFVSNANSALDGADMDKEWTTIKSPTGGMSGLLSLLDTSFGDFFTGNETDADTDTHDQSRTITTSERMTGEDSESTTANATQDMLIS